MAEFIYRKTFRKKSNKELYNIKAPTSIICFQDENTRRYFECNNVFLLKKKRNKIIELFFLIYSDSKLYDLLEFGIPYSVTDNISRIIQKIKRRCNAINNPVLGIAWLFDVGSENNGAHYHLVVALEKNKKKKYPEKLKISFKEKRIHGSYVRERQAFKHYLQGKEVFERGYRKRVFGLSKRFKTIRNVIDTNKI